VSQSAYWVVDTEPPPYREICRHCECEKVAHAASKCLLDSSMWDPMNESEYSAWYSKKWSDFGKLGADFIKEQLSAPSCSSSLVKQRK
jgi:hypothetical protein